MAVIAVDAGTTMIKAVGYDEEGNEVVVVRQATTVLHPRSGWAEQDMQAVWDAVVFAVRGVHRKLNAEIDYIALTAQGDGSWLVDDAGRPTGPAILWNDARAADIVAGWQAEGTLERAFAINGSQTFPGLPNAILTWMQQNDPERLARSSSTLTCGGWLFFQLTDRRAVDRSDGAAPFMNVTTLTYSDELFAMYDMPWARRLFPPLLDDTDRTSPLSARAAHELGLPEGLPVVLSSYDIASTSIGMGAVNAGQACSILGTTLCTEIVTDRTRVEERSTGLTIPLGVPGMYLAAFPTLAGGEVVQWACTALGLDHPADVATLASQAPRGADGLQFLPYLSPAGERAPFLAGNARGSFIGLSLEHGREHIARAVLEGLTFVIRDCLAAAPVRPSELRVCGGGAANGLWLQLIADVTGIPVIRSADTEVGAKGAFLLGLVATGGADSIAAVADYYVRVRDIFEPDTDAAVLYETLYDDFLATRDDLSRTWKRSAQLRERVRSSASSAT